MLGSINKEIPMRTPGLCFVAVLALSACGSDDYDAASGKWMVFMATYNGGVWRYIEP
jgi:hypothetical protein